MLLVATAAGGCGSSARSTSAKSSSTSAASAVTSTGTPGTPVTPAHAAPTVPPAATRGEVGASLGVESSARGSDGVFAPRYTCHGANESLPVNWVGASPKAQEIAILVRSFVSPGRFVVNWAVAGISPGAGGVPAGKVPSGAVVGLNSFGQAAYSLCPTPGAKAPVTWISVLALPHKLALGPGFDPTTVEAQSSRPGVQWGSLLGYGAAPAGGVPR